MSLVGKSDTRQDVSACTGTSETPQCSMPPCAKQEESQRSVQSVTGAQLGLSAGREAQDKMVPATQLGFNLQPLLEQLSQDELREFKSLLGPLSLQDESQHIPLAEVEEADGKQLAEILINCCPSHWVETVTIQVFDKMNRTDLSEKAKDELGGTTRTPETKRANVDETQQHAGEEDSALAQVLGEDVTNPEEAKEGLKGEEPGQQDECRSVLEEEGWQSWKENFGPGASENIHTFTQRCETLVPSCNPKMFAGSFAQTVVLHGPAGVGKTTLARKCMLDWTREGPALAQPAACFLSCKALGRRGPCTLAELLSEGAPDPSQNDENVLSFWMDLCSVFDSSKNLVFLDINQTFLSTSSVRILCEKIASATHNLQKVVLRNVSPVGAYRDFCAVVGGHETLTHLTLQGNDQDDLLPVLCDILRRPTCHLQCLRLVSCPATTQQWACLSGSLEVNQSLTCLNLTASELADESARLLCVALRHPKCPLQRLSLENCHLTEACCKELSSALVVNRRLTHLCLAKNALGNGGVRLLCEGLSDPDCQLQTLVLWYCSITSGGCHHLSALLQQNCSLMHLDLGLNHIGVTGLKFLCEALKKPVCNLKRLWLWGCAITPFSCEILASALSSNRSLISLDLGQNSLGYSGVKTLCDALRLQSPFHRTLRLRIDESDPRIQKLLKEIQESDSQLTIESDTQDPTNNRPSSQDIF
ncbi:NACHT, LRR and PYD domains-containing protein 2 [Suricata suricatta]|nr:NACHT, LRR and PYD domains-containing protein 2 [Suricata suricatta]